MVEIASGELRNDIAGLLHRVQSGEDVVITVNGRPVARLLPVRRHWLSRHELIRRLRVAQADAGLRDDLAELTGGP